MIINHNLMANNAIRSMNSNSANASKSMTKLSSGLRINGAADDAAGLAISEKMRAQIRGLDQASSNAQDGISLVQTAEGALNETTSILQRMRELATQSANDTNVSVDRTSIQKEMNQLTTEINRIGNTTEFNTQKLINGGGVQTNIDTTTITTGAAKGSMGGVDVTAAATGRAAAWSTAAATAITAEGHNTVSFNGVTIEINAASTGTGNVLGTADLTNRRISLNLDLTAATGGTSTLQVAAIESAFDAYKAASPTNELTGFTFAASNSNTVGGKGLSITSNNNTDIYNSATFTGLSLTNVAAVTSGVVAATGTTTSGTSTAMMTQVTGSAQAKAAEWQSSSLTTITSSTGSAGTITFNGATITITAASNDSVGDTSSVGTVTGTTAQLTLDTSTTAGANTATLQVANIAKAFNQIKAQSGSPLANFTFSSVGDKLVITDSLANGDTNNSKAITATTITGLTAGSATILGVDEVRGQYTYNFDTAIEKTGATINLAGHTFTSVASGADAVSGQFNVGSDESAQAKSLAAAMNAQADISSRFDVTVSGSKITLKEKSGEALGINLKDGIIDANVATAGKYSFNVDNLVQTGGKYTIDGVDIKVTEDVNDEGLVNGTAVMKADNTTQQAEALKDAIAKNAALQNKYETTGTNAVTVSGSVITLVQKTGAESMNGTEVSTDTNSKDGFEAKLQIGANTAQSMTVNIGDMRANALKITSDSASITSVTANNGANASYVQTKNVSNGTDNTSTEYALDVSTSDRATAAISVINDAIESVSAERSKLGAYQNRLEHTINNLGTSSENLTSAESRIRDVDMAKEMSTFSKNNILSQAAQAMLAQANQQPQQVLSLLR